MKLSKEYTVKIILFMICLIIILEIVIFLFIFKTSNKIYEKTISDSLQKSKQKATEIAEYINKFITNLLKTYITKLKLISRHSHLFIGKEKSKKDEVINKNSNIFLNKDLEKRIIQAKTEEINKISDFNKIYNSDENKFDYIGYYLKKFGNMKDNGKIVNIIKKEHDELNYISYLSLLGPTNINELDLETKKKLNYMIPIFKTVFLQRFIAKKYLMDIIRIIILNEKELIIYPPEDSKKINLHNFHNIYPDSGCGIIEQLTGNYYSCAYNYIFNYYFEYYDYEMLITEAFQYDIVMSGICVRFSFLGGDSNESILCIEVNFGEIIRSIPFHYMKNFNFGFFNPKNVDIDIPFGDTVFHYYLKDLLIIQNTAIEFYKELHEVFNSTETTPYNYVLDDYDPMKILKYYSLYHFIYFNLTKIIKSHPELNINISKIQEEYEIILGKIFEILPNLRNKSVSIFQFNITTCRKKLLGNDYECYTDEAEMNIMPLVLKTNILNEDYVEINNISNADHNLFIYSIVYINPETNRKDMKLLLHIKITRVIFFYILFSFIIIIFYNIIIDCFSSYSFDNINKVLKSIEKLSLNENIEKIYLFEENKERTANKEMMDINNIYNFIRNVLIIKESFDNELFMKKHIIEFYQITQTINNKNIKEICNSFLSIFHFNHKIYSVAETELSLFIIFIKENEKKLKIGIEDDKLKDAIKRSSTVSYINEYSNFENIDENMIEIIYLNIYKQKFYYLYAMTKFKLANELNIKKDKKYKEKKEKYFRDAIKYFKECEDINTLLGINIIKIIYTLIMISKCYINLYDYKNSIITTDKALSLYFKFSKSFNKTQSNKYNNKVMLFIETNIFQNILFTLSTICNSFQKPCASNYIILRILETSPFIFNDIHYNAAINLLSFLEKNKSKLNTYYKNIYDKQYFLMEYEKLNKSLGKIVSRLYCKNSIKSSKNETNFSSKNQNVIEINFQKSKLSSNKKADFLTSKMSSIYNNKGRSIYKNITIIFSDKIYDQINIEKFKYVLIKYLKKYFNQNENDKFSFIQFASNGKKNLFLQPCSLNEFCAKFHMIKIKKENINLLSERNEINTSTLFTGLYDILISVINTFYETSELNDNIIMIFMNSEDIRFSSIDDCINIVDELNKSNTSVFFFCFEEMVNEEKVNNIQSFLNGLSEGYFFKIKNYHQIKEIFVNLSSNRKQSNFFKFDYESFDNYI